MRIGFLTPEYPRPGYLDGGLANYVRKTAFQLVERTHEVAVFVLSDSDRHYQDGKIDVVEVSRAKPPRLPGRIQYRLQRFLPLMVAIRSSKRLEKTVWKYHRSKPLDILQTSSYSAPGFTLRRNGRIPLVCRISSYQPLLRSAFGRSRTFAEYLTDWLEIKQVVDADAAFAPSEFIAKVYRRMEAFSPTLLATPMELPNIPMDPSLYQAQFSSFPYFLFCGTLSRIKGIDLIAEAIPEVLKQHPETHFVFIGRDDGLPGGRRMMDFVLSNCKELEASIHYLPALPKEQLYPIMAGATALLIPSRVDNCPNVCLEAHALGVPVIGSLESSLEEMIVDGATGFLVENGNSTSLAKAMLRSIEATDQERRNMKEEIAKHVRCIRVEDRVPKLINLYNKAIEEFKTRR